MKKSRLGKTAADVAQRSKSIVAGEVEQQIHALGSSVSEMARDLEQVGSQLRRGGTLGSAAHLADWLARYVSNAGEYLQKGDTVRFLADLEAFGRQRPWAVAASAAGVGFVAARIMKSSNADGSRTQTTRVVRNG